MPPSALSEGCLSAERWTGLNGLKPTLMCRSLPENRMPKMTTATNQEAIMRYSTAKDYKETIKLVLTSPHHAGQHVMIAMRPTGLLLGFALELYFKAWLLAEGNVSKEVAAHGHRLRDLYSEVTSQGFADDDEIWNLVDMVAEPHGQERNYVYRYTRHEDEVPIIPWTLALPILDKLDLIVDARVGASESYGLAPGH